jgi:NADPH:quinone reductase-like Zn-dependent oxidoreductase
MPKMKIAVVPKPGADFEIQERDIPAPGQVQVRIKVRACGVCFSDHMVKDGLIPWITYPRRACRSTFRRDGVGTSGMDEAGARSARHRAGQNL